MIAARNPWAPDPVWLFAWDVDPLRRGAGVVARGGVTDDRAAALARVREALRDAPAGARGEVRRVRLSTSGPVGYVDLGTVAKAERTREGVSWV